MFLTRLKKFLRPVAVQALCNARTPTRLSMLAPPFKPSRTILIFSSAEYCLRVARRMSWTTLSPWLLCVPLFSDNAPLGPFQSRQLWLISTLWWLRCVRNRPVSNPTKQCYWRYS